MIATAALSDPYRSIRLAGLAGGALSASPRTSSLRLVRSEERAGQPPVVVHLVGFAEDGKRTLCGLLARAGVRTESHADVDAFMRRASRDVPGCLVVHAAFPLIGGHEFLIPLQRPGPALPIVVVAERPDVQMAVLAMKAGAVDFLETPFRDQEILDAVGEAIRVGRERREAEALRAELRIRFEALTMRERQVMALVTQGLLNKQVAGDLGLSEITVKVHRGRWAR